MNHGTPGADEVIGRLLIVGVIIAASVVISGAVIYLYHQGAQPVNYRIFRGEPAGFRQMGAFWSLLRRGSGEALIQSGLLVLVGVQWLRVALTMVLFARERDRLYVLISAFILGVLLYGFFLA